MLKKHFMWFVALLFILSACNHHNTNQDQNDGAKKEAKDSKTVTPKYREPLTGLGTDSKPINRAVAVMINNHPLARPQSGIASADVVYEVLAEGDITRFLAIFQSEQPKTIGPVRSAREYFIKLAKGYHTLYIAHGYSPEAKKMLMNGYIDQLNGIQYDGTLFYRSKARKAPHNSYITYNNILKGAKEKGYSMVTPPSSLPFASEKEIKQITGQPVEKISIHYSKSNDFNAEYRFDSKLQKLKRYSGGKQTIDANNDQPVLIDNLFIVAAKHRLIDDYGRRAIDLTSGGEAYLIQKGKIRKVEWENINGRILPYENGEPVKLVPGKTWINIVENLNTVTFE
ncbi:DUF3048 domain-containing protein [Heyndrickxia ginsengihumi]|uniref:DUF3048 domain-containing protein n=1 Tax=Heyndrickxia ginsengihumi TaxID=363870 RepID=UPI001DE9FF7C|nr:DUF3048 domain-containing protein [Heyndrickxia ginsengihumi]MBE6183812.1 DUF3048 domain-containing protein [Bacillus sp. (in: firmicutes)]MCM3023773.1 DUF3048 domain-containing protein [Heyndrickxia ginsengihumi]